MIIIDGYEAVRSQEVMSTLAMNDLTYGYVDAQLLALPRFGFHGGDLDRAPNRQGFHDGRLEDAVYLPTWGRRCFSSTSHLRLKIHRLNRVDNDGL